MTLFTEIDWTARSGGRIIYIEPDSVAAEIELLPGDELLAVNDNPVQDVIDVQYYAAEEYLELLIRRGEEFLLFEAERDYQQALGIEFEHPTFDTDIRRCNNLCEFASSYKWPLASGVPSTSRTTTTATPSSSATS